MSARPSDPAVSIAADDRTGALEVAGACASAGLGPLLVGTVAGLAALGCSGGVVDLASRHLTAREAAARAATVDRRSGSAAHKIDSTLRGNWAHEVLARRDVRGGRVLVVPALPALGRTCVDGVVLEHGRPVAASTGGADPRAAIGSSRPADLLRAAGATEVAELAPGASLDRWLAGDRGGAPAVAVCDAASDDDLDRIARACAAHHDDLLLASTSAGVAAHVAAVIGRRPQQAMADAGGPCGPTLVVCGSVHATSQRQVDALVAAGATRIELDPRQALAPDALGAASTGAVVVLVCRAPSNPSIDAGAAEAAAAVLAAGAHHALTARTFGTLVVIGGDTAAAVLGDAVVEVGGVLAPGIPWSRCVEPRPGAAPGALRAVGPVVVTKAGAFGDVDTLVRLLSERTSR